MSRMVETADSRMTSATPAGSSLPIDVAAVDLQLDMHAVVDQQHRGGRGGIALVAGELRVGFQRGGVAALEFDRELARDHAIGRHFGMASGRQRHGVVEKRLGFCDHLGAARLVVALAGLRGIVRDRIGAVEGVVKAAPARVRGIQRIARVRQRHHKLRPADLSDLVIDIGGLDLLGRGLRQEIADLLEEGGIVVHVERLALVGAMPAVDLGLQRVADREQLAVLRTQVADDRGQAGPESIRRNPAIRGGLLGDEIEQDGSDFQSVGIDTIHDKTLAKSGRHRLFSG